MSNEETMLTRSKIISLAVEHGVMDSPNDDNVMEVRRVMDFAEASAAIKDAEIAELKTELAEKNNLGQPATGIYHERYRNEIASRDLMIKELREDRDALHIALANSEHHNSRALDKMLLEAEIKGIGMHSSAAIVRALEINEKLAELNKE